MKPYSSKKNSRLGRENHTGLNRTATVISTDNDQCYSWGDQCCGWHLAKSDRLSVIEELVPPGGRETRHFHRQAEQFFYLLDGSVTIEAAGTEHHLQPHSGLLIDAGTPHLLINQGQTPARFLVISTPPSHGDRVLAPLGEHQERHDSDAENQVIGNGDQR